ncbi:GTPase activating protein [Lunasporangiospora selenospora]|uniref:GTPase-activating protein GYP7 n=1 Tax=Lunasporangiospora selenospora TaxID=979761 RepID=A0A9P6FTL4_9FUNG|nr:GTPase activating protein [Lunasporangiospora selenospora]
MPPRSPQSDRRSSHPADYAVHVPLQHIYSLLVYPPRMKDRHGCVIVNLVGGESLSAFFFRYEPTASKGKTPVGGPPSWGGQDLVHELERVVDVVGSAIEPGVYLVNASHSDKVCHGAATPPLVGSFAESGELGQHFQENSRSSITDSNEDQYDNGRSLYPKLEDTTPQHPLLSGADEPTESLMATASTNTDNGSAAALLAPITLEGMRRRRANTDVDREDTHQRDEQSSASAGASPLPNQPSSRPRTPNPFEQHIDPLVNDLRWNILERFSQVARFSRDAASNLLEHPITKQILPPHVQQRILDSEVAKRVMEEYDPARLYLAKWAAAVAEDSNRDRREAAREMDKLNPSSSRPGPRRINDREDEEGPLGAFNVLDLESSMVQHTRAGPLTPMVWFSYFDDNGRLTVSESQVREAVFRGGIDHDIRIEVWKFFLGIYPWDSTEAERIVIRSTKAEEYYALKREWFDDAAVQDSEEFQEQKLRIEKDVHRTDRTISFFASETLPNPAGDFTGVGSNENLELLKDILLTYNVWAAKAPTACPPAGKRSTPTAMQSETLSVSVESGLMADAAAASPSRSSTPGLPSEPNLLEGYVQGMSDLLAPVFAVMGDEVMGFWAFVGLMEKTKKNFYKDQVGMQSQLETLGKLIQVLDPKLYKHLEKCEALNLFFCFRWLLIWYKREFEWVDIMRLWEVLFSDHLSTQFHLFVAMAVLDKHRDMMMDHLHAFDEILKYVNDLSMTINLEETLQTAEILYRRLELVASKVESQQQSSSQDASSSASATSSSPVFPECLNDLLKNRS